MIRDVSIYQLPQNSFVSKVENVNTIVQTYFQHGELDRQFSWSLTVDCGGQTTYDNILPSGVCTPLAGVPYPVAKDADIVSSAESTNYLGFGVSEVFEPDIKSLFKASRFVAGVGCGRLVVLGVRVGRPVV